MIGRQEANPSVGDPVLGKDAWACVLSRDKLRKRPGSVAGGAPRAGYALCALAVL